LDFEEQSTVGRGISGVRGRTRQQGEGNYLWRFIICTVLTKRDVMWGSINASFHIYGKI
jgi:hypothetical protein